MNFFGHDSNASNDPRLKKLLAEYGFLGTGLYWHIIELISRHLDPPREQSCELQEDIKTLAYAGRMPEKKTTDIIKFMVRIGLFEKSKSGKLVNTKVLRRLSDAQKKKVRRTPDGHPTDTGRGEVNRSEEKRKEDEKKRSEGEGVTDKGGINKSKIAIQIEDLLKTLDKPNLPERLRGDIKKELRKLEESLEVKI